MVVDAELDIPSQTQAGVQRMRCNIRKPCKQYPFINDGSHLTDGSWANYQSNSYRGLSCFTEDYVNVAMP